MASPDALRALVEALVAEQDRRRAERQKVGDDNRKWLLEKLATMHEAFVRAPDYVPMTAEEEAQSMIELEARFRELGYGIAG